MHKPNLVACLVILLTFSVPAFAAGTPGSTGAPGGAAPGTASSSPSATASPSIGAVEGGHGAEAPMTPEKLAEVKAMLGKRLDAIIDDLQKRRECIKEAATSDALRVCIPRGPRPGEMGGRPQGQQQKKLQ